MSSNGPWIAIANRTMADRGIARLAGNAEDLDTNGTLLAVYTEISSSLDSFSPNLVFCENPSTNY